MYTAAIFASPLAEGLYHKAIVQSGIMSTGSIDAAESFTPEDRIAPTTSGLEVFSRILIAFGETQPPERCVLAPLNAPFIIRN